MHVNVAKEMAALEAMRVAELRAKYAQVFGEETRAGNKTWLVKRIIWRMQALAEGDLSERARRRAAELAQDADLRLSPPRVAKCAPVSANGNGKATRREPMDGRLPLPGTILTRWYKGQTLKVQVLRHGFEYGGRVYKSLSAAAKAITGSHTSGYLFFRRAIAGRGANTRAIKMIDSGALALAMIGTERDGMITGGLTEYDKTAGLLIAKEAGAVMSEIRLKGHEGTSGGTVHIVASDPQMLQALEDVVKSAVKRNEEHANA